MNALLLLKRRLTWVAQTPEVLIMEVLQKSSIAFRSDQHRRLSGLRLSGLPKEDLLSIARLRFRSAPA